MFDVKFILLDFLIYVFVCLDEDIVCIFIFGKYEFRLLVVFILNDLIFFVDKVFIVIGIFSIDFVFLVVVMMIFFIIFLVFICFGFKMKLVKSSVVKIFKFDLNLLLVFIFCLK